MEEMHFIYINAKGYIDAYSVTKISYSDNHIQGICKASNTLKTFRKDRVICQFESETLAIESVCKYSPDDYAHLITKPPKKETFDICFTGFKKADKDRLAGIATEHGLIIRSSVTQNLNMLCCGYNAGPTKVSTARMKGVIIIDESQFIDFLETCQIPDI